MSVEYDPEKYERNKMDISAQEAAFAGFIQWSGYVTIGTIAVLIFLLLVGT